MVVHHNGMSDGVDATSSRTTGQLGKLAGSQPNMPGAVEFLKLLNHHTPCGHVNAQSQRFRGEDHFNQAFFKQAFDNLAEQCDHSRMMRSEPFFQGETKLREMQRFQVFLAQLAFDHLIDDPSDLLHFVAGGEFQACVDALVNRLIATVS